MNLSKTVRMLGLSAAVIAVSAGAAFAATATSSVNVRTGPGTQYNAIDTLRPGERVGITDQSGGWCEVSKSGPDGWVSCRYLTSDNSYRSSGPSVSIQFGFGTTYPDRYQHPRPSRHHYDDGGYWSGPGSSHYSSSGNSFGLSFSN